MLLFHSCHHFIEHQNDDYEEQSFEVLFIPDDAVECVAVQ